MNKYEGPGSAYARNEGAWVPGSGVNLYTGTSIATLIIRDYLRGYTYDGAGKTIPMDKDLFKKRLFYLIALCHKHTRDPRQCDKLKEIIEYAYKHLKLPPNTLISLAGPNARKIANELVRKGIVSIVRIVPTPTKVVIPRRKTVSVPARIPLKRRR